MHDLQVAAFVKAGSSYIFHDFTQFKKKTLTKRVGALLILKLLPFMICHVYPSKHSLYNFSFLIRLELVGLSLVVCRVAKQCSFKK